MDQKITTSILPDSIRINHDNCKRPIISYTTLTKRADLLALSVQSGTSVQFATHQFKIDSLLFSNVLVILLKKIIPISLYLDYQSHWPLNKRRITSVIQNGKEYNWFFFFFFFAVVFLVLYLTDFWQFHQQKVKFWTHNISHWLIVNKEGSPKATPQKCERGLLHFAYMFPFCFSSPFNNLSGLHFSSYINN